MGILSKSKLRFFYKFAAISISTSILAFAAQTAQAKQLKLGVLTPAKQAWTVQSVEFGKRVKEVTQNRHSLKVFHSGQLGNEAAMIRQLQAGTLDFALITVSELANRVPEYNALLAPGLVKSNEHAARFLTESKGAKALLGLLSERIGAHGLAFGMAGVTQVMTRFEATGPQNMAGKRTRITPSPAILEFNKIIGSAPAPIPLSGVYDAFANGQVDALETNLDIMRILKLEGHAKTLLLTNQGMFPAVVLVSTKAWAGFSDQDKAAIRKAAQKYGANVIEQTLAAEKRSLAHFRKNKSLKIVEVDPANFIELQKKWDKVWTPKAPQVPQLRAEAKTLAGK